MTSRQWKFTNRTLTEQDSVPSGPGIIDFTESKLGNIFSKNRGYSTLKITDSIINGEISECDENKEMSVEDFFNFEKSFEYLFLIVDYDGVLNEQITELV
ncbi:Uncharacterized protein FWK35_00025313 [Aphis craccivora]|uniref:Uncharacterized protein n=1 Tax=Aphis craccivora TaxID=307492 RepID=A0A6G0YT11_APHCR|nr:Uncharacterized protein FWK35_00025313 [Aphis craccivora]